MKYILIFLISAAIIACNKKEEILFNVNSQKDIIPSENKLNKTNITVPKLEQVLNWFPLAKVASTSYLPSINFGSRVSKIYLDESNSEKKEIHVFENEYDAADAMLTTCDKEWRDISLNNGTIVRTCSGRGNECGVIYNSNTGGVTIVICSSK